MRRVINPAMGRTYEGRTYNIYVEINYKDGKLSIHGVGGPKSNGDCIGSCGQNVSEVRSGDPKDNWTPEMITKLCDIWDRWHLNDMRPECEHQRALGWKEKARQKVKLYHWTITTEANTQKRAAENAAVKYLKDGKTFLPTREQIFFARLEYFLTTSTETLPEKIASYYTPQKSLYPGGQNHIEEKTLGWLRPEEHPDGLLCRPCPVCGYKYGTSWLKEEVPKDVIDWLFSLPISKIVPAWI